MEEEKRKEYEEWFQNQQKEAMEYSSVVQYRESKDTSTAYHASTSSTHETKLVQEISFDQTDAVQRMESMSMKHEEPEPTVERIQEDGRIYKTEFYKHSLPTNTKLKPNLLNMFILKY